MTDPNDTHDDPTETDDNSHDVPGDATAPRPDDEADGRLVPDGDVAAPPGGTDAGDADGDDSLFGPDMERKLKAGAAVVLGLLATWATIQVYASTAQAIELWISSDFVPIFQAAFNVVVVLVAVAGIVWLVRELG